LYVPGGVEIVLARVKVELPLEPGCRAITLGLRVVVGPSGSVGETESVREMFPRKPLSPVKVIVAELDEAAWRLRLLGLAEIVKSTGRVTVTLITAV